MEEPGGLAKDGLMLEIYLLNLSLGRKKVWGGEGQSKVQDRFPGRIWSPRGRLKALRCLG